LTILIELRVDAESRRKQQADNADDDGGLPPPRLFFILTLQSDLANFSLGCPQLVAKFDEQGIGL
jgi:hypothetical protein